MENAPPDSPPPTPPAGPRVPAAAPEAEEPAAAPAGPPERAPKWPSAWFNQPLPVGVLVLVATYFFQQCGWEQQQRFIEAQSRAAGERALAQTTTEQVAAAVSKLLTAYAGIVGAHEAKVGRQQFNEAVDRFTALQMEWDQGEELLKYRVRTCFTTPPIEAEWSSLMRELGALDEAVKGLDEFGLSDPSAEHAARIKLCREAIEKIEERLKSTTTLMTEHVRAEHAARR